MTGSGKTTWARKLLQSLRSFYPQVPVYILDSKQSGDFTGWPGAVWTREAPGPIAYGMQIWQPPFDDVEQINQWLGNIHRRRAPAIILLDELSSLAKGTSASRATYPVNYATLMKQGRALGQCVISLTQEAAYIPRQTMNQSTHLVRFMLLDDYDTRKIDQKLGRVKRGQRVEEDLNPRDPHGFFYARIDKLPLRCFYYPSYHLFF